MAQLSTTSSRIRIWSHGDAAAIGAIDPTGIHLTKRILIKAGTANTGDVYIYDQTGDYYYPLDAGQEVVLLIDDSRLVGLGASAANQAVHVLMELQVGATG